LRGRREGDTTFGDRCASVRAHRVGLIPKRNKLVRKAFGVLLMQVFDGVAIVWVVLPVHFRPIHDRLRILRLRGWSPAVWLW